MCHLVYVIILITHLRNKECYLRGKKGCKNYCCLKVSHQGKCICSIGEDGHLCDKECSYFKNTRIGCKERCILKYGHSTEQKCICSAEINEHIHRGECYLKSKTREGCLGICKYQVDHEGYCLCESSIKLHVCNGICCLNDKSFKDSCNKVCKHNSGHDGNHLCNSVRHECNEPCKYKNHSRSGCLEHCCKELGHKAIFKNEHICNNSLDLHKCNGQCHLINDSRGCNGLCDKLALHNGEHLCNSNEHLCKEQCVYYNNCKKGCNQFCSKRIGHRDQHDCNSKNHFCKNKCHLQDISRLCSSDCSLYNGHDGPCVCKKTINEHYCNKVCQLCQDYCCNIYGHNGNHLCNKEHECNKDCEQEGCCVIETNNYIKKIKKTYQLKSKQKIEYEEENKQISTRKKCILKIPRGEIEHKNKIHKCDEKKHKCGFKCKQCDGLCQLDYGHTDLHYCIHGNIKNSLIQTEEKSIKINYQNKQYDFENEEAVIMFTCYQYCREQKRGHVHRINKSDILYLEDNLKNSNIILNDNNVCECKCEYFWKTFLSFRFETEFDNDLIKEFNLCPAKCGFCDKETKLTYCNLKLWHREWHDFSCGHEFIKCNPCHTIFIIDKSGSMNSRDISPKCEKLKNNLDFNNRLGCVIHVVDNYVKKRLNLNKEDCFSFVSFNDYAEINFKNYDYNKLKYNDLIDDCLRSIKYPDGGTKFIEGFKKANEILSTINSKYYRPVMILLSDGEDWSENDTLDYVQEVSN